MMHLSGPDRSQILLLPEVVDDYVGPDNPVRFIDAFVDGLDLAAASFSRVEPKVTGRPAYAPVVPLLNQLLSPPKRKGLISRAPSLRGTTKEAPLASRDVERIARTLSLTCCTATDLVINRTTAFEAIVRWVAT